MAEINIFGFIGSDWDGTTLKQVSDQLTGITDNEVIVNISSGGGYVNEGLAIFNLLRNSKKDITVHIIGQAYSIASVIAMAGKKIYIAEFADMMLHPAWAFTEGNAEDLRKTADELDIISAEIFKTYLTRDKAKDNESKLKGFFDEENYIKANECVELGLCDGILENQNATKYLTKYKAVAYFDKPKENKIDMKKENIDEAKSLLQIIRDGIKNMFHPEVKNASKTIGDTTCYYDGEFGVGTKVYTDEAMTTAVSDGTYGDVTVSGGEVTAIAADATDAVKELETAQAKVAELEAALALKNTEINDLKTTFEAEKAENKAKINAMMVQVDKLNNIVVGEEGKHKESDDNDDTPKHETMSQKMKRLNAENQKKYSNII